MFKLVKPLKVCTGQNVIEFWLFKDKSKQYQLYEAFLF